MAYMKTPILGTLPFSLRKLFEILVSRGLSSAHDEIASDPSYHQASGVNDRGRCFHRKVDSELYNGLRDFPGIVIRCVPHACGEYLLLRYGNIEICTKFLRDRNQEITICENYQIEKARNNPSGQGQLFDESEGQNNFFALLCSGSDQAGEFAFLHLPSSALYVMERLDLNPVNATPVSEEIPTQRTRFIAKNDNRKSIEGA